MDLPHLRDECRAPVVDSDRAPCRTAASTRDSSRLLARAGSVALLALALLLPAVAAGDNSDDKKAPKPPANLRLMGASSSSLTLGWDGSPGASERIAAAGYTLYRNQTVVATTPATTFTFDSLSCSASYTLEVDAFDAAGNHSERVKLVAETGACLPSPPPDTQPPTAPGSLTKGATTTTSIAIAWTASTDNVAVTGYSLYRDAETCRIDLDDERLVHRPHVWHDLHARGRRLRRGRQPLGRVRAAGRDGCLPAASASASASGVRHAAADRALGSLTKGATTTTSIAITWTASTDNVAVTGYSLYRNGAIVGSNSATSYAFTSLTCGTTYRFGAAAYDAAGNRSAVSELSAATDSCPPPPRPAARSTSRRAARTRVRHAAGAVADDRQGSGHAHGRPDRVSPGRDVRREHGRLVHDFVQRGHLVQLGHEHGADHDLGLSG